MERKQSDRHALLYKNEKGKIIPLDDVNLDILKNMLNDATVSDSALATKLNLAGANIKRRRRLVEANFASRNYLLDVSKLGWRIGDIQVDVGKGKSEELAEQIFAMYPNILEISLRVNSTATVSARVFYKDNNELFIIIDKIKRLPFVRDVAFSEIVKIVRSRSIGTMKDIFPKRAERVKVMKAKKIRHGS
ncbi:MAG TPA: Lrp/AsnC family transcriptional regulator [Nitrososphaera sp.]|nr:Lrp/AsnC family transcriptional regulator [Nitrososphaera sp.]